jgi:putative endonuclease
MAAAMEKRPVTSRVQTSRAQRGATGYARGLRAETLAAWWLRLKGYRILATRWKSPAGELDLIALRGRTIVAVEVKARSDWEAALHAIRPQQRVRIEAAFTHFIARHPRFQQHTLRLDAVLLVPRHLPRHITHAWDARPAA